MSLILLRASSRRLAAVLMFVCLWSLPHRSSDDDRCVTTGLETHDESKHVFSAGSRAAHDDHCAICHWMRSLKPVFSARYASTRSQGAGSAVVIGSILYQSGPAFNQVPARAPPFFR